MMCKAHRELVTNEQNKLHWLVKSKPKNIQGKAGSSIGSQFAVMKRKEDSVPQSGCNRILWQHLLAHPLYLSCLVGKALFQVLQLLLTASATVS
eukprot:1150395-Pelagomonas_calceolata.AAC.1